MVIFWHSCNLKYCDKLCLSTVVCWVPLFRFLKTHLSCLQIVFWCHGCCQSNLRHYSFPAATFKSIQTENSLDSIRKSTSLMDRNIQPHIFGAHVFYSSVVDVRYFLKNFVRSEWYSLCPRSILPWNSVTNTFATFIKTVFRHHGCHGSFFWHCGNSSQLIVATEMCIGESIYYCSVVP